MSDKYHNLLLSPAPVPGETVVALGRVACPAKEGAMCVLGCPTWAMCRLGGISLCAQTEPPAAPGMQSARH